MKQEDITEGRRVLAALTPGPWVPKDFPNTGLVFSYEADARAVLWLLQHGEELLRLAERVAAVEVQTTPDGLQLVQDEHLAPAWTSEDGGRWITYPPQVKTLLADATALAALVEAVQR